MRAHKLVMGLCIALTFLLVSCHKYDLDDFPGISPRDKVDICKDGHIRTIKAYKLNHWLNKGYVALIDQDGDGAVTEENSCDYPVDCDDDNSQVFPGADDNTINGIDDDCDGEIDQDAIIDEDGDGFAADVDCDDTNADINPGAFEICDDGVDNNCNGSLDCEDSECETVSECVACAVFEGDLDNIEPDNTAAGRGTLKIFENDFFLKFELQILTVNPNNPADIAGKNLDIVQFKTNAPAYEYTRSGGYFDQDGNVNFDPNDIEIGVRASDGAFEVCAQQLLDYAIDNGLTITDNRTP